MPTARRMEIANPEALFIKELGLAYLIPDQA
jgi:hypothetical protein